MANKKEDPDKIVSFLWRAPQWMMQRAEAAAKARAMSRNIWLRQAALEQFDYDGDLEWLKRSRAGEIGEALAKIRDRVKWPRDSDARLLLDAVDKALALAAQWDELAIGQRSADAEVLRLRAAELRERLSIIGPGKETGDG